MLNDSIFYHLDKLSFDYSLNDNLLVKKQGPKSLPS